MADVFLSYARKDAERAEFIKTALENLGLDVFFDTEGLDGGDVFPDVLEREIRASGAVVSVWNTWALSREWVRRECEIAREEKSLIPVEIGEISDAVMTIALSKIHRLTLHDFDGNADHPGWQKVVQALARTLNRPDLIKTRKEKAKAEARAEKLARELEKQKARNKTLAKRKGGLGWKGGLVVLAAVIAFGGVAGKFALDWQAEQTRNRLIPPEVQASLATFDTDAPSARQALTDILEKVKIRDLIQAAPADPDAALLAGWAFGFGEGGVAEDQEESVRLYKLSCDGGNMRGCNNLGIQLANGQGAEEDDVAANALYRQACEGGDMTGCNNLGVQLENGEGAEEDDVAANALYRKACEGGNMDGCTSLGVQLATGQGADEDDVTANALYRQACEGGDMRGCSNLGVQLDNGEGAEEDDTAANALYRQACDGGNMAGCTNLGIQLANGDGTEEDDVAAAALFRQACEGGNVGCAILGNFTYLGLGGIEVDKTEGLRLLRDACSAGNQWSCGKVSEYEE